MKKVAPVWHLIVDGFLRQGSAASPVLGAVRDIVIARQLHRGLLDSDIYTVTEPFDDSKKNFALINYKLCDLPEELATQTFLKKKDTILARIKGFNVWRRLVTVSLYQLRDFPVDDELYFELALRKSQPEYAELLLEYADTSGITVQEAEVYLRLYVDERVRRRISLRAAADKAAAAINACTTEAEVDEVIKVLRRIFFKA